MTKDVESARLFSGIRDLMEGFDEDVVDYAIINVMAIHILNRCVGKQPKDAGAFAAAMFTEVQEAIIANLKNDTKVPTVGDLLKGESAQ